MALHSAWGNDVSIDAVAAQLRQAVACLPLDLLEQAAVHFDEARTIFAVASQGTNRPEAGAAIQALSEALSDLTALRATAFQAKALIETYVANVAGGEHVRATPVQSLAPRSVTPTCPRSDVDQELVAELMRQGKKITPERVVRIGRDKAGKVVWMEEGTERSGLTHLMDNERVAEFANQDVTKQDIVDLVFTALARGEPIGITSTDRIVYALTYGGRPQRVAITVASNGYIVGANPVGLTRKIKPLP